MVQTPEPELQPLLSEERPPFCLEGQVPLDGIPSLRHANRTTQLDVICKLPEGALNPTVYVIDEDIEQYLLLNTL
ncbi:testosterone 17-beta-dehydrogenase 3-like [Limosa lapponica baueri]|uniref:Testosterone 17-beta-dehydrogenase 3-like n=1 Tax=Limosa lapponica baueri TaxID=1758121 RepID=A0A2I0T3S5_LIMLA|nr:testosterone 17-beta-dehydrogenase 3-like [Limosa lapponica baueri]